MELKKMSINTELDEIKEVFKGRSKDGIFLEVCNVEQIVVVLA